MAALAYPARSFQPNRPRRAVTRLGLTDFPSAGIANPAYAHPAFAHPEFAHPGFDRPSYEPQEQAPLAPVVAFPTSAAIRRRFARRRLTVLVSAVAFFAAVWFGSGLIAGSGSPRLDVLPESVATAQGYRYVVQPGDTVWSIATRLQPTGDVRPLVDRLDAAFGGSVLHAGESVLLP